MMVVICTLALLASSVSVTAVAAQDTQKPNILVIWGDDVGMWNISAYHRAMMGGETPNIDRIADEGMLFMDAYLWAGSGLCCTKHISAIRAVSRRSLHQALRSAFGHSEAGRPHHKISCDAPNRLSRTDYQSAFWPRTSR